MAHGITRGLGYGLPPYSVIYAAAVGVIAGLLVHGLFAIKTRWLFRLSAAAVVLAVLGFGPSRTRTVNVFRCFRQLRRHDRQRSRSSRSRTAEIASAAQNARAPADTDGTQRSR